MNQYKILYGNNQILFDPTDEEHQLLSAELTQEAGKSGELTIDIAQNNTAYDAVQPLKTRVKVYNGNALLFSGRVLNYERDMFGIKTVTCEGDLSYLVDSIQRPYDFNGYPADLLTQYINNHNSQVEADKQFVIGNTSAFPVIDPSKIPQPNITYTYSYVTTRRLEAYSSDSTESRIAYWVPEGKTVALLGGGTNGLTKISYLGSVGYAPSSGIKRTSTVASSTAAANPYYITVKASSYENTLDAINTNLVDALGGFLRVRHENGVMYLDYLNEYPDETADQPVEFGLNMLDLNDSITAENIYTVIIPLGASVSGSRVNISTVNNGSDMLESATGIERFGRIVKAVEFDDQTDPNELKTAGLNALNNAILEAMTINISAVDISSVSDYSGGIVAGKYIMVKSVPHGITESTKMLCTESTLDLINPENSRITIGSTYGTLTDTQNRNWSKLRNNIYTVNGLGARVTSIEEAENEETTT